MKSDLAFYRAASFALVLSSAGGYSGFGSGTVLFYCGGGGDGSGVEVAFVLPVV